MLQLIKSCSKLATSLGRHNMEKEVRKNQRKYYFGGGGEVSTIADATNIRKELLLAIEKLESAHVAVCQANARVRKIALTEESTSVPMSDMKELAKQWCLWK